MSSFFISLMGLQTLMISPVVTATTAAAAAAATTTSTTTVLPPLPQRRYLQDDCEDVKCRVLEFALSDDGSEFDDEGSIQSKALEFLENTLQSSMTMPKPRLQQVYALMCIFHSTNNVSNEYTGDNENGPGEWIKMGRWGTDSNFCTWYGVTCSNAGYVTALELKENNLSGSIPNEMELLGGSLLYLDLQTNSGLYNSGEKGTIWLSRLNKLEYLDISTTSLEYQGIPLFVSRKLEYLDISFSNWQGPQNIIPFVGMSGLEYLGMSNLKFMKCLPGEEMAIELPMLRILKFDNVEMDDSSGPCDIDWLTSFSILEEVWFTNTNTGGATIPTELNSLSTSLHTFAAGNAGLEGMIPSTMGDLTELRRIWLFSNNLSGNIPIQLNGLNHLTELFVEGNPMLGGGLIGDICLLPNLLLGADCLSSGGGVVCTCCDCCSVDECEQVETAPTDIVVSPPTASPKTTDSPTKSSGNNGSGGEETTDETTPTAAPSNVVQKPGGDDGKPAAASGEPTVAGNVVLTLPPMAPTAEPVDEPTASPSANTDTSNTLPSCTEDGDDTSIYCRLINDGIALQGGAEFEDPTTYQSTALSHIDGAIFDVPTDMEEFKQLYALLCLHFATYEVPTPYEPEPEEWKSGGGWRSNRSPCDWDGLICEVDNPTLVTDIILANNSLAGHVPDEIQLLSNQLLLLDVSTNPGLHNAPNQLEWIGKLTKLQYLALGDTAIQYPGIPDWINQLTDLGHLDVHFSLMQGPLDVTPFVGLSQLTFLDLGTLLHTNCFPSEIATETNIKFLYLDRSIGLEGCPLDFMTEMTDLKEFWMDQTNTGGEVTLPAEIGTLTALTEFSASFTNLTGPIPPSIGDATSLEVLWLFQNNLTGQIPSEVNKLNKLEEFYLEGNPNLSGGLVGDICLLDNVTLGADCDLATGGTIICNCCTCCDPISCGDFPDSEDPTAPEPNIKDVIKAQPEENDAPTAAPSEPSGNVPVENTESPTTATPIECDDVLCRLSSIALQGGKEFRDPETYQSKALDYIFAHVGTAMKMTVERLKHYYALSCLYHATYAITQSNARVSSDGVSSSDVGGWENSERWMSTVPAQTEFCSWYGVECNKGRLVVKLDLNDNNLHGMIPPEITLLNGTLEELDVSYNAGLHNSGVDGGENDLASWIGNLGPNMKVLALRDTAMAYDGIPTEMNKLSSLERLDLGGSQFRGPKDASPFTGLSNLTVLALDGLEFDNCFPGDDIAAEVDLTFLSIQNVSGLSACSWDWIGMFESLVQLWMDHTNTDGAIIPPRIGRLANLTEWTASYTNLGGTIPKNALGNLVNLKKLWLQHNRLEGTIPEEINQLVLLEELYLQGNPDLSGHFLQEGDAICALELELGTDCTTAGGMVECECCTCCSADECGDFESNSNSSSNSSATMTAAPTAGEDDSPTATPMNFVTPLPTAAPSSAASSERSGWWLVLQGMTGVITILATTVLLSIC